MSFAEIKEAMAKMSMGERLEVAALIAHLNRLNDVEYQSELDRRMIAMDADEKVSEQTFKNMP